MKTFMRLVAVVLVFATAACAGTGNDRDLGPLVTESGISFERNTSFDGEVLRIELPREDGGTEKFSSGRDEWFSSSWAPFIPNHVGRRWGLIKAASDHTSLAYAVVSWDNDDPTDYLAVGYWLRFPGTVSRRFRSLSDAENTPFFDGPEVDPSLPPRLPISGTATYVGPVGGLYTYRYGSDWTGFEEPVVTEEFQGIMTLSADFSDNTVAGCMGCVGDLDINRQHLYLQLGFRRGEPLALPTDYEVHFGATPINRNGTFEHTDVEVRHPTRPITGSSGFSGGMFSNVPDADGNPRLAIGLTRAEFDEADGSQGKFEALFTGLGASLRPTEPSEDR